MTNPGPQIGEEAKMLPERQQRATFRLDVRWQALPLWTAYRPKKDGGRILTAFEGFLRQWGSISGSIKSRATYREFLMNNLKTIFFKTLR